MRQAGRHLPEYCEHASAPAASCNCARVRAWPAKSPLQPLARYDLDAAILFSDILTVPDAMGLGLYFAGRRGPRFERPLKDEGESRSLAAPDPHAELQYVMDAVSGNPSCAGRLGSLDRLFRSPWTLACYMVEGGSSSDYRKVSR